MTRKELIEEMKQLEHQRTPLTIQQIRRVKEINDILVVCICRVCKKEYNNQKTRGDYKGFCTAKCQHEMAKRLGFHRKHPQKESEYSVLARHKQIGDIFKCT